VGTIRTGAPEDARAIAEIHAARIADGFLVRLGRPFLRRLYRRATRSPNALVLVIDDGRAVQGFIAATDDTRAFYRDFLVHDGVLAGLAALPRIASSLRSVLETLRYGVGEHDNAPKAEILAIAVTDAVRHRGAGTRLIECALEELGRRSDGAVRVVTALDNVAATRAYERAGFHRRGTTTVHRGVPQAVLEWP
jgi:ribosomal protein S18 acetylase RimI-like enzyme